MGVEFESTPMGEPLWESLELCVDGQAGVWWAQPAGARMCMSTSACTANLLQPARAHACDPDLLWRRTCLGLRVRRMCVCCKVAEVCVRGFVGSCVRDCVRASACACLRACLSANKGGALSSAQRAAREAREACRWPSPRARWPRLDSASKSCQPPALRPGHLAGMRA